MVRLRDEWNLLVSKKKKEKVDRSSSSPASDEGVGVAVPQNKLNLLNQSPISKEHDHLSSLWRPKCVSELASHAATYSILDFIQTWSYSKPSTSKQNQTDAGFSLSLIYKLNQLNSGIIKLPPWDRNISRSVFNHPGETTVNSLPDTEGKKKRNKKKHLLKDEKVPVSRLIWKEETVFVTC